MNFSCEKATLLSAINIASKALPTRSVNPVNDGLLLSVADPGSIRLTATDNALTIQTRVAAEIREEGDLLINGKFFFEVIRRMPDGMITVQGNFHDGVEVSGSFSKMKIAALDPDEYPELPVMNSESFFTLPQGDLKKMINQTMFATAADESRPVLTGCLFEVDKESINIVALDGYRLALRHAYMEDIEEPMRAIIPARALSEVTKILSDTDELVRLYIQKSFCLFEIEETKIMTRLIDGEFIKYRPIIPTKLDNCVTIDRLSMLEAIDRAWLIVRENTRNNYIVFRFSDDKLIITSRSDTGNAYEEISYSGHGSAMEIGFQPRYFVECLKNIEDEFITFSFTTPSSPTVIKPVDGDKYLYLILPVRL